MAKTTQEVLNRDYAMRQNMGPDGKRWGVTKDAYGWGLFQLGKIVEERDGTEKVTVAGVPEELTGYFTSEHRAQKTLETYLRNFWDKSDDAAARSRSTQTTKEAVI